MLLITDIEKNPSEMERIDNFLKENHENSLFVDLFECVESSLLEDKEWMFHFF